MPDCIICTQELETNNFIEIKDINGTSVHLCKDCEFCYNCESSLAEEIIDESNWVSVKRPHFPGNWISLPPEKLKHMCVIEKVITCNCCKIYHCKKCETICNNYCTDCDSTCNDCECAK